MTTPKLYMVRISTEDREQRDIFASTAKTLEKATREAAQAFTDEDGLYSEEDQFELYELNEVGGYKVTLTKV